MFFGSCCVEWVSSGAKAVLLLSEWWVEPRRFYHWVNGEWSQGCCAVIEWVVTGAKVLVMSSGAKALVLSLGEQSQGCFVQWMVSGAKAVLLLSEWRVKPRLFYCWVNGVWSHGSCTVTELMSSGAKALVLSLSEWSKGCCWVNDKWRKAVVIQWMVWEQE